MARIVVSVGGRVYAPAPGRKQSARIVNDQKDDYAYKLMRPRTKVIRRLPEGFAYCEILVERVLKEIIGCLERGETVKLSSFGSFIVRKK
jgi:Bacterial DNA-binding protein